MRISAMALVQHLHPGVGAHTVPLKQHSPKEKNGWEEETAAESETVPCSCPSRSRSSLLILLTLADDV
jgi:hypothetical protein